GGWAAWWDEGFFVVCGGVVARACVWAEPPAWVKRFFLRGELGGRAGFPREPADFSLPMRDWQLLAPIEFWRRSARFASRFLPCNAPRQSSTRVPPARLCPGSPAMPRALAEDC